MLSLPSDPNLQSHWNRLLDLIRGYGSAVVAFSGGVDSGLVCAAAHTALNERMLALTIHSPVDPPDEVESAAALARQLGFSHEIIDHDDLNDPQFVANPPDRCYHCKRGRFQVALEVCRQRGYAILLEGSNADDAQDYRPGARAVRELGVRSPLAEAGLAKADIRAISRALGLVVADRPSAPCLATRFPYGTPITREGLRQVTEAEQILREAGFGYLRVRHHGAVARIEVAQDQIERLVGWRDDIVIRLKQIGFQYVTVDLQGYRSGSMNESLST